MYKTMTESQRAKLYDINAALERLAENADSAGAGVLENCLNRVLGQVEGMIALSEMQKGA